MKSTPNYRPTQRATLSGWLPVYPAPANPLTTSHWLSRAARGHTWNANGADRRHRTH